MKMDIQKPSDGLSRTIVECNRKIAVVVIAHDVTSSDTLQCKQLGAEAKSNKRKTVWDNISGQLMIKIQQRFSRM
jgi:hypothetical protein